jgi:polyhydroxyalkanoate synthesis regulator phasin
MAERRVNAFFETYDDAAKAITRLEAARIPSAEISLVSNSPDHARALRSEQSLDDEATPQHGFAAAAAAAGTVVGGGAGLLAGMGTVAVPGIGPLIAAGWIVTALVGAGVGAATGGLVGALVDAGFSEEEAQAYADDVRRGGTLVTVRVDEAHMERVVDLLDDSGTIERGDRDATLLQDAPAPPIGAAASTATGLMTDFMPSFIEETDDRLHVEVEDERLRRVRDTDRDAS